MLNNLEKKLDYKFKNRILIKEALTHPSFQKKSLKDKTPNNQRLEFLGDSVLDLIVTEHLYRKLASFSEGKLTKIKSVIVSKDILATLFWEKGKIQPEGEKNHLFLQIVLKLY